MDKDTFFTAVSILNKFLLTVNVESHLQFYLLIILNIAYKYDDTQKIRFDFKVIQNDL